MNKLAEDIKNSVLQKIRLGEIHKRPRVYFIIQIISMTVIAFLTLITSLFAISFILFSIHESGELFLLGFGARGFITFLSLFPWFTLCITIVLIFLLEWLMRHFKFNYHRSVLTVFFWFISCMFFGGLIISLTPLHT